MVDLSFILRFVTMFIVTVTISQFFVVDVSGVCVAYCSCLVGHFHSFCYVSDHFFHCLLDYYTGPLNKYKK